ncbi:hypothetical protein ACXHQT_16555 [Vibrio cincinnatiensis]|uniref:hypothetical protein n=1 Tax=Vibrio cincinnatiensis TaxID=675 RepID=UPI001EDD9578|nr:hypothetical protein [Vibrio cincinnatiensis]MCG3737834.1 hypothetical protein [Vibrio cincinnatiensis]
MKCRLCGENEVLQKSHIIPKSYFKSLKKGNGQLVSVTSDDTTIPKKINSDPKEELLCRTCEQFLSDNYEKYGTRLFKNSHGVKKTRKYIEFNGFKYTEYYLFLISILWRASISSLEEFSNVQLQKQIESILARSIKRKSIKLQTSLKLDHFIRISVLRVVDSNTGVSDEVIKSVFLHFGVEHGKTAKDGMVYYFMISGFLIGYFFSIGEDIHDIRAKRITGQLVNRTQIKIPKVELIDLKQVHDGFKVIYEKSKLRSL